MSIIGSLRDRLRYRFYGQVKPMVSEDRSFLETIIFPWLGRAKDRTNILFAGTALYTALYPRHFPGHHFHTIDMMRSNRLYGAPGRHVVGNVTTLEEYYAPDFFDVLIFNGLIGFGLNEKPLVEKALAQAAIVLKPGGLLILGWNDIPRFTPYRLESLEGLSRFRPHQPPFLPPGTSRHGTDTPWRHTFDFFKRAE